MDAPKDGNLQVPMSNINKSNTNTNENAEGKIQYSFNVCEMLTILLINRRCLCGKIRKKAYFIKECRDQLADQMDKKTKALEAADKAEKRARQFNDAVLQNEIMVESISRQVSDFIEEKERKEKVYN